MHEIRVGVPIPRKYFSDEPVERNLTDWLTRFLDLIMSVDGGIISFTILGIVVLACLLFLLFILLKLFMFFFLSL